MKLWRRQFLHLAAGAVVLPAMAQERKPGRRGRLTVKGPSQVMLIRHGEKLGDPSKDDGGGFNLSIQGSARAAALPALFALAAPEIDCKIDAGQSSFVATYGTQSLSGAGPRFATPDFIFATSDSKHSTRPRATATPTAVALGVPFDCTSYSDSRKDIERLAARVTTESQYEGKFILICWHHGTMQELANQLGVQDAPPWNGHNVFDRVWVIDYSKTPLTVSDQPQQLLYTDSRT
jgi:hypothetical protein